MNSRRMGEKIVEKQPRHKKKPSKKVLVATKAMGERFN